ncbi:MAG: hypothetical protein MMC33_006622 [Icmadophila ericetorum]|nr:hypothetical protein [Icmadophila ericetorum]
MVLNTVTVGAAVTPTVIKTYLVHYLNRKPRHQKPTAHISYDEGLNLIRQFLHYASFHTVEEIQAFTSQWVPSPRWVKVDEVTITEDSISRAAELIRAQLGHRGIDKIGGKTWWTWRREGSVLKAEWIEMRGDYNRRKKTGEKGSRVVLYVHGGAYFFGSVDEHRYQLQRHARKLKARVLARLMVVLRDQGIPLPAGAVLISPWVDLTHSFPSVSGNNPFDYIPAHGFINRPSYAWPPPNADDMEQIAMHAVEKVVKDGLPRKSTQLERQEATQNAIQGFSVDHNPKDLNPKENANNPAGTEGGGMRAGNTIPGPGRDISIMIDGNMIEIKDQIQMYTTNQLISHPLVSPVLQPSLGGLPPLLILTGGGEALRDEQIYLAHKAANPSKYPPGEAYLDEYPDARDIIEKYKPTYVQLQVWDDLCHVAPTLSFTRPAKYMYRSIAQFGAWALARAQETEIEILDDDNVSVISSGSDTGSEAEDSELQKSPERKPRMRANDSNDNVKSSDAVLDTSKDQVGKAGDPLPKFVHNMIRQRVDRHGTIYPLAPAGELPALQMSPNEIGIVKPGPVKRWITAKTQWDSKFAKEKRRAQRQRVKEIVEGYQGFGDDEAPPPSALAGRRHLNMQKEEKKKRSWGMSLWSLWGSSHDKDTIIREEKADQEPEKSVAGLDGEGARPKAKTDAVDKQNSRSRSRRRAVIDTGQTTVDLEDPDQIATKIIRMPKPQNDPNHKDRLSPNDMPPPRRLSYSDPTGSANPPVLNVNGGTDLNGGDRPRAGGIAFPFKLGRSLGDEGGNASTITLNSNMGPMSPKDAGDGEGSQRLDTPGEDRPQKVDESGEEAQALPDDNEVVKEAEPAGAVVGDLGVGDDSHKLEDTAKGTEALGLHDERPKTPEVKGDTIPIDTTDDLATPKAQRTREIIPHAKLKDSEAVNYDSSHCDTLTHANIEAQEASEAQNVKNVASPEGTEAIGGASNLTHQNIKAHEAQNAKGVGVVVPSDPDESASEYVDMDGAASDTSARTERGTGRPGAGIRRMESFETTETTETFDTAREEYE